MLFIWIGVAVIGLAIFLWFFPVTLWFQALISGVRLSLIQLVLMRWRGVSPNIIVMAMVTGTKAGLKLYANELEAHYLAKGNVPKRKDRQGNRPSLRRTISKEILGI